MKRMLLLFLIGLLIYNCETNPSKSKDQLKGDCFILCEGNFTSSEASLWLYDGKETHGPVYWDLTANPLGSVGQSMTIDNDNLYILVNASNEIKVLGVDTQDDHGTISLPAASPRYLVVWHNYGYVSCWGAMGIIKFNLNNYSIEDTIAIGALPEYMVLDGDMLYVSITMNAMWGSDNRVIGYDLSETNPVGVDTFEVISNPGMMLLDGNELWVSSTYYDDAWQTYAGMSKIDLNTKSVIKKEYGLTSNFSTDLLKIDSDIYTTYNDGIVKLDADLNMITSDKIGYLSKKVYCVVEKDEMIYFGTTDYVAPDTVYVLNKEGEIKDEMKVGALPGDIIFVK
ncbi:MAG: hypothetical protein JXQ65_00480 [Candidatus Marinimicrobia bacterium]|nr:hypothetical protein [Candidatus Neomarinimicrobiota bacterium]